MVSTMEDYRMINKGKSWRNHQRTTAWRKCLCRNQDQGKFWSRWFLFCLNLSLVIYQSYFGFIAHEWSVDPTKILVKVVFDSSKLRWRQLLSVIYFLSSFKLFSDIVLWAFVFNFPKLRWRQWESVLEMPKHSPELKGFGVSCYKIYREYFRMN